MVMYTFVEFTRQTYLPVSEVVRGENVREDPLAEILPSPATADPFIIQVTSVAILVSTDEPRSYSQLRVRGSPANRLPLTVMAGVEIETEKETLRD